MSVFLVLMAFSFMRPPVRRGALLESLSKIQILTNVICAIQTVQPASIQQPHAPVVMEFYYFTSINVSLTALLHWSLRMGLAVLVMIVALSVRVINSLAPVVILVLPYLISTTKIAWLNVLSYSTKILGMEFVVPAVQSQICIVQTAQQLRFA